jgi:hypothetical protein
MSSAPLKSREPVELGLGHSVRSGKFGLQILPIREPISGAEPIRTGPKTEASIPSSRALVEVRRGTRWQSMPAENMCDRGFGVHGLENFEHVFTITLALCMIYHTSPACYVNVVL